jgi:hypothetical protein
MYSVVCSSENTIYKVIFVHIYYQVVSSNIVQEFKNSGRGSLIVLNFSDWGGSYFLLNYSDWGGSYF